MCASTVSLCMLQVFYTKAGRIEVKKEVAMSLANLSFPIHELTWEHYWVVMEELGLSETETTEVLTKVLGPVACLKFIHHCSCSFWTTCECNGQSSVYTDCVTCM